VQYELVVELRDFLLEHVFTCFFTNYYFEHGGQRLNDYQELSELPLQEDPLIYMRADTYDEKNARNHVKRVREVLAQPVLLTSLTETEEEGKGVD